MEKHFKVQKAEHRRLAPDFFTKASPPATLPIPVAEPVADHIRAGNVTMGQLRQWLDMHPDTALAEEEVHWHPWQTSVFLVITTALLWWAIATIYAGFDL